MTRLKLTPDQNHKRNAYIITLGLMVAAVPTMALLGYFGLKTGSTQLYIPAVILLITLAFDILILYLIRQNKVDQAMLYVMLSYFINTVSLTITLQGLGPIFALALGLVFISISGLAISTKYTLPGIATSFALGGLIFALDWFLPTARLSVPELQAYTPYIIGLIAAPILFVFISEFNRFSLQVKITLGILLTGGFTVATLIFFALDRAGEIGSNIATLYENSARNQVNSQITTLLSAESHRLDDLLLSLQDDVGDLTNYRVNLENESIQNSTGSYWNAAEELFWLSGRQFDNTNSDPASIYIPNTYSLSETVIADLNKSIYLDFIAPSMLETHPEMVALYYISKYGYTVYYPNIDLAKNVPPNYDPTQDFFYTIATPANNPDRKPRWTSPYDDPAGTGLIITVSIPVYHENDFLGVMSADVRLTDIVEKVSQVQISKSGFPLLVDNGGLIIAMPETGYSFFGLTPPGQTPSQQIQQSILASGSEEVRTLALQITSTQAGISKFNVSNTEMYVAVDTLESTGFKIAFIAPTIELEQEIATARNEVDQQLRETIESITLILGFLFTGAFITSLVVGQVITRPLKRLTETVEQIAGGNLASRAIVESGDESGVLARSFNIMADRLTETLQGLEDRIAERTKALEAISQNNVRRAALFEAIARISRIINSTRKLEQLLPQITETISDQLDYYHVGIFLLDTKQEFAILVAANSDGGRIMLNRGHRLEVGATGIVGYVTQTGQARVALDVGHDAVYFNNPDLPDTHSEIALPLRSGAEIIGALDVQSEKVNAFTDEDLNILSVLADQVSVAIQNARSFQQSVQALEQAERAIAQLSRQQWDQFIKQVNLNSIHFNGVEAQPLKDNHNQLPNQHAIPIILRGVQIGTLKLSTPDLARKWDENEIAIAQATAERTALAIENARLLLDAQKRAAKQQTIGQISSKIGSLVNIENIIQTTIQELGSSLPDTDVAIQFTTGQSGQ